MEIVALTCRVTIKLGRVFRKLLIFVLRVVACGSLRVCSNSTAVFRINGMAVYWEPLHGFNVGTADGSNDADSDSATNAGECVDGTDPLDAGRSA